MKDTRLSKFVMVGEIVGGAGCLGGQDKEWMGCLLDNPRAFGINVDQAKAQDGGPRGGRFHGETDRFRESQGWTTACSTMPERDRKDQGEDGPKQASTCWFTRQS